MKDLASKPFRFFYQFSFFSFLNISSIFLRNAKRLVGSSICETCLRIFIYPAQYKGNMTHLRSIYLCQVALGQDEDLCKGVVCPRGEMCVPLMDSGVKFTICQCPTTCPTELNEPLCSYYNRQFNSRCEMHKYACAHDLTMKVKNQGSCPSESKYQKQAQLVATRGFPCGIALPTSCACDPGVDVFVEHVFVAP